MSNMSYCRFQNTLGDLRDCLEAEDPTSIEELRARVRLYEVCDRFVKSFDLDDLKAELKEAVDEENREGGHYNA